MENRYVDFLGVSGREKPCLQILTFFYNYPPRVDSHKLEFSAYGSRSLHKIKRIERSNRSMTRKI